MNPTHLIKLTKKYKKTAFFLGLIAIFVIYRQFLSFFYDTSFKIYNKTGYDIVYKNPEISNIDDPPLTDREIYSLKASFQLKRNEHKTLTYDRYYWHQDKRFFGLFFGADRDYELKPAGFIDEPTYPNQKPACSYKIEVYTDKTVVTPTGKWFCKKPMYNYKDFNPYAINQDD